MPKIENTERFEKAYLKLPSEIFTFSINTIQFTESVNLEITFNSTKFEKECSNYRLLVKRHGSIRARRIINRLDDLRYANVLQDMRRASGRCHELRGNRSGQLSLDLDHPDPSCLGTCF